MLWLLERLLYTLYDTFLYIYSILCYMEFCWVDFIHPSNIYGGKSNLYLLLFLFVFPTKHVYSCYVDFKFKHHFRTFFK